MASVCLRCLKRSIIPVESSLSSNAPQRAAFSTSQSLAANPPKKKAAVVKGAKTGSTLRLAKNRRVTTARPPAPGERKAQRKRIVLSNTNALEVQGLQDFTAENVSRVEKLEELQGKVVGFGEETVEALRALEAFKATQGWGLFRRPASLVRSETVEIGTKMLRMDESKAAERMVLFGERLSGKSVVQMQSMAMAHLQGWVVVHFPEARDIINAQTSYQPTKTADGQTLYIQPHYTAQLLLNISKANRNVLSKLRLSKQHQLPIPVQSNISLARFVDLGANDPQLAYPIWQALISELTAPSGSAGEGLQRPPVFISMDGVDHIMRMSAYLDSNAKPVHAHELAIVRDFTALLSGETALPNGGVVLAATNSTDQPSVPTMRHCLERGHAVQAIQPLLSARDGLRKQAETAQSVEDIDYAELEDLSSLAFPSSLNQQVETFQRRVLRFSAQKASVEDLRAYLSSFEPKLPEWDPYQQLDQRVAQVMRTVRVEKVDGLTKQEARAIMEYYAHSGMMRATVTEGLVGEKWALAGNGIIGELEKGAVRARF